MAGLHLCCWEFKNANVGNLSKRHRQILDSEMIPQHTGRAFQTGPSHSSSFAAFCLCWRGLNEVIGPARSGESRPLVWGHKTVSQYVCSPARSKGHAIFSQKHTHTHTRTEASSIIRYPLNNYCGYLGKVIICSPVFQSTQQPGLRRSRHRKRLAYYSEFDLQKF